MCKQSLFLCGTICVAFSVAMQVPVYGWASRGHAIAIDVALRLVSAEVREAIDGLAGLSQMGVLSARWDADCRKRQRNCASQLVPIPSSAQSFDSARDCVNGNCAVSALVAAVNAAGDISLTKPARIQALSQVVGLVADLHQPLRMLPLAESAIYVADGDRNSSTLLDVWDSIAAAETEVNYREQSERIYKTASGLSVPARVSESTFVEWANGSHALAVRLLADTKERDQKSSPLLLRHDAVVMANGCPGVTSGGSVKLYEAVQMG